MLLLGRDEVGLDHRNPQRSIALSITPELIAILGDVGFFHLSNIMVNEVKPFSQENIFLVQARSGCLNEENNIQKLSVTTWKRGGDGVLKNKAGVKIGYATDGGKDFVGVVNLMVVEFEEDRDRIVFAHLNGENGYAEYEEYEDYEDKDPEAA